MLDGSDSVQRLVRLQSGPVPRRLVGGKGASLSRLAALGAPVPFAMALTTNVYHELATSLSLPLRATDVADGDLPGIRARIESAPLPPSIAELFADAFHEFERECDCSPVLAVRSSATAEDSAEFSFAGLHDTILDVRDLPALEHAVRQCWASLWSERATTYRRSASLASDAAEISVVLQVLIPSDVSFVVFTADPVSGNDDNLIITATWGLGEAVVSGIVVPDQIVIAPDGHVIEYSIGDKHCMIIPGGATGHGVREVPVPRALRGMAVMSEAQAMEIGEMARDLSVRLGFDADIEGAISGGKVYLFQARPITTLKPRMRHA